MRGNKQPALYRPTYRWLICCSALRIDVQCCRWQRWCPALVFPCLLAYICAGMALCNPGEFWVGVLCGVALR